MDYVSARKDVYLLIWSDEKKDLYSRVVEHKEKKYPKSFTARYNLAKLVYFEPFTPLKRQ